MSMLNPALILLNLFKKPLAADTRLMLRPRSPRPVPAPPQPRRRCRRFAKRPNYSCRDDNIYLVTPSLQYKKPPHERTKSIP